jgi:hypothetical protein
MCKFKKSYRLIPRACAWGNLAQRCKNRGNMDALNRIYAETWKPSAQCAQLWKHGNTGTVTQRVARIHRPTGCSSCAGCREPIGSGNLGFQIRGRGGPSAIGSRLRRTQMKFLFYLTLEPIGSHDSQIQLTRWCEYCSISAVPSEHALKNERNHQHPISCDSIGPLWNTHPQAQLSQQAHNLATLS